MKRFDEPILVTRPYLPDLETFKAGCEEIWRNRWLTNNGPMLKRFEGQLAEFLGTPESNISLFVNGVPAFGGMDGGILAHPVSAERANPINYITKNSAPMLLMHGTADSVVSPAQTDLLFQALRNHGIEAERWLIPDAEHADEHWQQENVLGTIAEFLIRHVS